MFLLTRSNENMLEWFHQSPKLKLKEDQRRELKIKVMAGRHSKLKDLDLSFCKNIQKAEQQLNRIAKCHFISNLHGSITFWIMPVFIFLSERVLNIFGPNYFLILSVENTFKSIQEYSLLRNGKVMQSLIKILLIFSQFNSKQSKKYSTF